MIQQISDRTLTIQNLSGEFAADEIAGSGFSEFPMELWRRMGTRGLLGLGLDEEWGGMGGNTLDILLAAEALVREGHIFGMAFSMMIHNIVARFVIARFSDLPQKQFYLPELASGRMSASLAISEPGAGNHPKNLRTSAVCKNGSWHITGEKMYLSNGPFADIFIVLAITGLRNDIKEYTAFIVPADTPGLSRTQPPPLNVLKPSPHCGIKLDDCIVPDKNILGVKGEAYKSIAIPFRDAEDVIIMGAVLGAMARQIEIILEAFTNDTVSLKHEFNAELGWLGSTWHAMHALACDTAVLLDDATKPDELTYLLLTLKSMAGQHLDKVQKFFTDTGLEETPEWISLMNDLRFAVRLGDSIGKIRAEKMGNLIMNEKRMK